MFCGTKIDIFLQVLVSMMLGTHATIEQQDMPCVEPSTWQCITQYCPQQDISSLSSTCRFLRSSLFTCIQKDIIIDTSEPKNFDYESFLHWLTVYTNKGQFIKGELTIDDYYNDDDWGNWALDCLSNLKRLCLCSVTWSTPVLPSLEHLELEFSSVDISQLTSLKSLVLGEPARSYLQDLKQLTRLTRLDIRIGEEDAEWLDRIDNVQWPLIAQLTTLNQLQQLCIAQIEPYCDYALLSQFTKLSKLTFRTAALDGRWFDGTQMPQVKELVLDNYIEFDEPSAFFSIFIELTSLSITTIPLVDPAITSLTSLSCLTCLQQLTVRPWLPNFDQELVSMTQLSALTQVNKIM